MSDEVRLAHGGTVRGRTSDGVAAFVGVPYGRPPVGPLRFGRPRPATWTGSYNASGPGVIAPQRRSRLEGIDGPQADLEQSEDCLAVNVWRPASDSSAGRPVLVFVHGGAFLTGGGALDWYDGHRLAARGDLVVVTVTHRLGVLGYGAVEGPNAGLHDVVLALQWVRDNIAGFGGDPDRVTAAGQSAGALSLLALLGREHRLFGSVILQSTPAGLHPQDPEQARRAVAMLGGELGALGVPAADVDALRGVPVGALLDAQTALIRRSATGGPGDIAPPFHLVADDDLVATDLVATAAERAAGGVRVMIGTTRDEGSAFVDDPAAARDLTEQIFSHPSRDLVVGLAAHGNPAWEYRFDWSPPGTGFGATHCIELPALFDTWDAFRTAPMLAGADPGETTAITEAVQARWTAFAHGRTPDPEWRPWTAENPETRILRGDS